MARLVCNLDSLTEWVDSHNFRSTTNKAYFPRQLDYVRWKNNTGITRYFFREAKITDIADRFRVDEEVVINRYHSLKLAAWDWYVQWLKDHPIGSLEGYVADLILAQAWLAHSDNETTRMGVISAVTGYIYRED